MSLTSANPDNANPIVHKTAAGRRSKLGDFLDEEDSMTFEDDYDKNGHDLTYSGSSASDSSEEAMQDKAAEEIDSLEIYDLIRSITDPEHPLTLEQLAVVSPEQIKVTHGPRPHVALQFTPTIPHCSMATLIGLTLRVRLLRALPDRFKVDIRVKEGSHESENSLNKQLNDKERVAAALENTHLLGVVENCLATSGQRGKVSAVTTM